MIVECPGCKSRYDVSGRPPGTRARCRCGTVFELPNPTREAGQLCCPRCGANVGATNHQCEHCHAELKVLACPRCFARVFHGSRHCQSCGAEVVAPAAADPDGRPSRLACPRCAEPLTARLVADVLLDECGSCHGVWVDVPALERILEERRRARAEGILGRRSDPDLGNSLNPKRPSGAMYVKCPECQNLMNRTNFAGASGVIVDTCRNHGTWFDANELEQIVEFVMNGGLERAKRKQAERMLADARREKQRARAVSSGAGAASLGGSGADYAGLLGSILFDYFG